MKAPSRSLPMQFVGKVISSVSEFYRDINPSTLSGAIDVVVVENVETGELACSPFHVRFGKLQLLRPQEKAVELKINGVSVGEELRMKVGEAGETFFVLSREELGMGGASDLPSEYLTSPLIGPETPVPMESIEEFKLAGINGIPVSPTSTTITTTSTLTATATATATNPISPEWKWEWGDLPIKKNEVENERTAIDHQITSIAIDSSPQQQLPSIPNVELYEFLAEKDYLSKAHEILARFPARSMITRIYKIDRGLHFYPSTTWHDQLSSPAFLNESARVTESDFLLNPNVVIEESSRLLYQFTWENRKIALGGSVGAAVVFYAQTYARILPLEIVLKLAEIAAIRMAKKKFAKSIEVGGAGSLEDTNVVEGIKEATGDFNETNSENVPMIDTLKLTDDPHSLSANESKTKSGWRSWWSRSSANSTSASSANLIEKEKPMEKPTEKPIEKTEKPDNSSQMNTGNCTVPSHTVHSPTPLSTSQTSAIPSSPSPLLVVTGTTGSPKKIIEAPATLSSILADSDLSASNSSVEERSPSKRIIQRTTSISNVISSSETPANEPASPTRKSQLQSQSQKQQYIKSLRLPSHLLKRLNLKPGVNTISYTVNTRLQGTATCQSRIFFWRSDARVVISDIDGTITKSDALGHLFTMVGKDWTHVGVAQLYSKIAANGYEFLYLTSRAIGQAASTRGYLKAVEQDRLQLPDGPVIMSPDRLFTALHREVIQRRPDEFKIACLRDIQKLFVNDEEEVSMMGSGVISSSEDEYFPRDSKSKVKEISSVASSKTKEMGLKDQSRLPAANPQTPHLNPFYAGFGNRPTDTKSYKAVGISASRIFLINPAGDLKLDKLTFYTPYSASSYSKLTEEVDKVFPPVRSPSSLTRVAGDEAFTDFQYWHGHGGDVRMDLVQMALSLNKTKIDAVVDEQGKPISPVTLQKQLGGVISTSDLSDGGSTTNTSSSIYTDPNARNLSGISATSITASAVATPPPVPPRNSILEREGDNDADEEEEEEDYEEDDLLESIDSFPFI